LLAIGDLHGCINEFRTLIEQKIQITRNDKLILLGDYIDRGTHSKEVIDLIIELKEKGFDVVPLMGNHESMLLDAYRNDDCLPIWFENGGGETLKSFEITSVKSFDSKYIDFFSGLRYFFEYEDFLFVHAGFNDLIDNPFDDKYSMIWCCKNSYKNKKLKYKTIIHGHSVIPALICKELVKCNSNVIGIDTGCVYAENEGYGILTAIEVKSRRLFFA